MEEMLISVSWLSVDVGRYTCIKFTMPTVEYNTALGNYIE